VVTHTKACEEQTQGREDSKSALDLPKAWPFESQSSSEDASNTTEPKTITLDNRPYPLDHTSNLSPAVTSLIGHRLYDSPNHPISITRKLIESVFPPPIFSNHVAYNPVASTTQNFDILGFPADHPGRSRTDTYYVNATTVLRTHTSAHQHQAFQHLRQAKHEGYTICADVYRRDSIDKSHFPVFHQMEGARVWPHRQFRSTKLGPYLLHKNRVREINDESRAMAPANVKVVSGDGPHSSYDLETNPPQTEHSLEEVRVLVAHLKRSLETLVGVVFDKAREAGLGDEAYKEGQALKVRWVEAYFPFTSPSFELEIFWQGEWMELLGSGIVQDKILKGAGLKDSIGWAWGLGVERLAMILFGVPDIRLFWSEDPRFLNQFKEGKITRFVPFSKYPACYKDVAFWINAPTSPPASPISAQKGSAAAAGGDATKASPTELQPAAFHENDLMEIVRDIAGSLAEDVAVVDEFVHPTSGRKSLCYRINYRSLERTLTNEEVNEMHKRVVGRISGELDVELR
jgi:phenylalanyl-tRNA synthetase alpha chain